MGTDPLLDPLRSHLTLQLKRGIIGRTLGFCPRTEKQIDVRTAVWILDPEGLPHMGMHPAGWAEVLDDGVVPALIAAGITVELDSIADEALRQRTADLWGTQNAPEVEPQAERLF